MKINFPKKINKTENWTDDVDKDILDIYVTWYEKYTQIIRYISNISTAMFIFSSTFLMSDFMNKSINKVVKIDDFQLFFRGLVIIFLSIVFSFICLLATYNWLRTVIEKIKQSSPVNYNDLFNDNIYSDKNIHNSTNTKVWGAISWFCGYMAGILLIVGLAVYGFGVWRLLTTILENTNTK